VVGVDHVSLTRWQVFVIQAIALVFSFYGLLFSRLTDGAQALCIAVVAAVVTQVVSSHATALGTLARGLLSGSVVPPANGQGAEPGAK
jgi:hypothetical protein